VCLLRAQPGPPEAEQEALRNSLAEAGSSQVDFIRAIEKHLEKYPQTAQRAELERALAKAATEVRDARRVVMYGERVLANDATNAELLERVSRYLLSDDDRDRSQRARQYARRLEDFVTLTVNPQPGMRGGGRLAEERAILLGKALVYQSRAAGNLGELAEAEKLGRRSYEIFPTAEAAREVARWLERQGKIEPAIQMLAEAFMIPDPNSDEASRGKDRVRLGEWHRKWKQSEAGLGDLLLAAYDRTQAAVGAYRAGLRTWDANAGITDPMEFTLSGLGGDKLALGTLKGKAVVLDFWATWCGPCRAQQPLYEQVKERFSKNPDVVLLNINTDENKEIVKPFLEREKWNKTVYFEDGLSALLRVSSIPTTVVINRRGEISSRMNGYVADRFVDMLTERIQQALAEK
jgi:thiol-disulfide isomerase/thioredoxin